MKNWISISDRILWELTIAGFILALAVGIFFPIRHTIKRARLLTAYLAFFLAIACYLAVAIVEPARLANRLDPLTWWLNRSVVGALLFVAVRIIDRVLVIPMFSRGGTIQVPRFIHQLIQIVLSVFVVLMYGQVAFGWPINDFLTGGAVVSIVLGLALQESLGNLFSGLVLQAAPPFVLGDFIRAGELEGRVVDMTWRAVTLHTNDDNYVVIPNGTIAKEEIINYHAPNSVTARVVKVGLEYELPPCDAIDVLMQAAIETEGVQTDPPPVIMLNDFADSAVVYAIKFWIKTPDKHLRIEHEVRMHAWYRLKQKGYGIPFPIRTVEHVNLAAKQRRFHDEDLAQRLDSLVKVPLLAPLSEEQHRKLAEGARSILLSPGQVLFTQDEPGESLYIIRRGTVDVLVKVNNGTPGVVATVGPPSVIGEMSALTGQPRSATIRAATAVSLVEIGKSDLAQIFNSDPSILQKISELITARNAERNSRLKDIAQNASAPTEQAPEQSLLGKMMAFFAK